MNIKRVKSRQKMSNPERKTSQEMNEIIWSIKDDDEEYIRPKLRHTGGLEGMKDLIM